MDMPFCACPRKRAPSRSGRSLLQAMAAALTLGLLAACGSGPAPAPTPTSPPLADELTFYDWEGDIPQAVLDAFTQEYGVKVRYDVYESQEEAIENMQAGQIYDVVVMESRFVPMLIKAGLLAAIDYRHVPNFRNIAASFRDLTYDPGNQYSVPFNWGTTGLVVRSDLVQEPVTRWADLWDAQYAGRAGLWFGVPRDVVGLTLKSLGYSANSEQPEELEAALRRLLELKPNAVVLEDYDLATSAGLLNSGQVVIAMGYAYDVLEGRELNTAITYILPQEGALLWGDNFVIPANTPYQHTAELFLNFLLRGEISAQIANENRYATANEAAIPFIDPDIANDPVIFPPQDMLKSAEIILPLSPAGEKLYADIWKRLMAEDP